MIKQGLAKQNITLLELQQLLYILKDIEVVRLFNSSIVGNVADHPSAIIHYRSHQW